MPDASPPSAYLRFLPSIYATHSRYTGLYLKIFEKVLSGIPADEAAAAAGAYGDGVTADVLARRGMGELLAVLADFFFPRFSFLFPGDTTFLPPMDAAKLAELGDYTGAADPEAWLDEWLTWMATWLALVLEQSWDLERKRLALARILPLYRLRGTIEGLQRVLAFVLAAGEDGSPVQAVVVTDTFDPPPLPIVVGSYVVSGAYLDGDAVVGGRFPYAFLVLVTIAPQTDPAAAAAVAQTAERVIRQEKPAHTQHRLVVSDPATPQNRRVA